jgi:hypothetical protein
VHAAGRCSGAEAHCSRQARLLRLKLWHDGQCAVIAADDVSVFAGHSPKREAPPPHISSLDDSIVPEGRKYLVPDADAPRAHQQVARLNVSTPVC